MVLKVATVCAANMNRSMAAHALLQEEGFDVHSFGVGNRVKLPGASRADPNVYEFGKATYADIHRDLQQKDAALYQRTGLLQMLERNMAVKPAPQRWQNYREEEFDVAITFEERIMDQLVDDMHSRTQTSMKPLLVLNIDVTDNHQEAAKAAVLAVMLCKMIAASEDWETEIDDIVARFQQETERRLLYTICWY